MEELYKVKFNESCEIEGRYFFKGDEYPVYRKCKDTVLLVGENGEFRFKDKLMEQVVKEWELEVIGNV